MTGSEEGKVSMCGQKPVLQLGSAHLPALELISMLFSALIVTGRLLQRGMQSEHSVSPFGL